MALNDAMQGTQALNDATQANLHYAGSKWETICFLRFQALVLICGGAHYYTT